MDAELLTPLESVRSLLLLPLSMNKPARPRGPRQRRDGGDHRGDEGARSRGVGVNASPHELSTLPDFA